MDSSTLVRAYAIAATSVTTQRALGLAEPLFRGVPNSKFHAEHQPLPAASWSAPQVQSGIAFMLGADLAGPQVTAADVVRAVDFVLPAVEISDGWTADAADADSAVVLGSRPSRLADAELRLAGCLLYRNGELAETGAGGVMAGSPVNAVAWLANQAGASGFALSAGTVVVVCSMTKAVAAAPGDTAQVSIAHLGTATAVLAR
jgi:2-keto-4-pentenoate hydratase